MSVDAPSRGAAVRSWLGSWAGSGRRAVRRRVASLYAGDWFVIVLTVVTAALAGSRVADPLGAGLALGLGLTIAVAIGVAASGNPLLTVVGAGVVAVGGALTAALLAFAAILGLRSGVTGLVGGFGLACLSLAGAGAFLTPAREITNRAILRTVVMTALSAVGVVGVLALRLLPDAELRRMAAESAVALTGAGIGVLTSTSDQFAVATFLVTLSLTAAALRAAQTRVPIERFLPADRRDTAATVQERSRVLLGRTFRVGFPAGVVAGVLLFVLPKTSTGAMGYVALLRADVLVAALPGPLAAVVEVIVRSPGVRTALLALFAGGAAVTVGIVLARRLRRGLGWLLVRLAAPVAGGAVAGVVAGTALEDPSLPARLAEAAPESVPVEVVALLANLPLFAAANVLLLLAMGVFWGMLWWLLTLRGVLVLPGRAGSAALASVGLFGLAVVGVLVGKVVIGVAVAVVALAVWDVGEFRAGLSEELPATAPSLRVEVVHATGALVTTTVVAAVGWGLFALAVPAIRPADPRIAGAGLVVLAAVTALLTVQVRG